MKNLDGKIITQNEQNEVVDYHSGEKEADMLRHIIDGMFMMLKREKNDAGIAPLASDERSSSLGGQGNDIPSKESPTVATAASLGAVSEIVEVVAESVPGVATI